MSRSPGGLYLPSVLLALSCAGSAGGTTPPTDGGGTTTADADATADAPTTADGYRSNRSDSKKARPGWGRRELS